MKKKFLFIISLFILMFFTSLASASVYFDSKTQWTAINTTIPGFTDSAGSWDIAASGGEQTSQGDTYPDYSAAILQGEARSTISRTENVEYIYFIMKDVSQNDNSFLLYRPDASNRIIMYFGNDNTLDIGVSQYSGEICKIQTNSSAGNYKIWCNNTFGGEFSYGADVGASGELAIDNGGGTSSKMNLTWFCTDNDGSSCLLSNPTLLSMVQNYSTTSLEETNQTFSILFQNYNLTSSSTANMTYNGTTYNGAINYVNSSYVQFNLSLITPIVNVNNTNISFRWNYSLSYSNGTTRDNFTDILEQNVTWKYYPIWNSLNNIEGMITNFTFNITSGNVNITNVLLEINGTNFTMNITSNSYNVLQSLPQRVNISTILTLYPSFNINYSQYSFLRKIPFNLTLYEMLLTYCGTVTNTSVANFTILNQTTNEVLNATLSSNFVYWNNNISFYKNSSLNYSKSNGYTVCIYPSTATYTTNAQMIYESPGFSSKLYYLYNNILSSTISQFILYLTRGTTQVTLQVVNVNDDPIENALIKVLSYDVGTDTYTTTEILQSDTDGNAFAQLVLNTNWYAFIVEINGVVRLQTVPTIITSTSKKLRVGFGDSYIDLFSKTQGISSALTFISATNTFSLTYSDPSGDVQNVCLNLKRTGLAGDENIGTTCLTSTAGTININATSPGDDTFVATSYANFDTDDTFYLGSLSHSFETGYLDWGKSGLFITFLVILTLSLIALWSAEISVVMATLGLVASILLGMFYITYTLLVGLIIIIGLAIWRMSKT